MSKIVTAAEVRTALRTSGKAASLSEAAQATVAEGARGRLHPEAIKAFNKGRKAHRRYVLGAGSQVKAQAVAARAAAAEAGIPVGKRGPLPKAAKVALGQVKG